MNNIPINFYDESMIVELNAHQFDITDCDQLNIMLESESAYLQYKATVETRKLLSLDRAIPIDITFQQNCIPKLLNIISQNLFPHIVFEAAWALTIIAKSTDYRKWLVLQNNTAQVFTTLLSSKYDEIVDQALSCLGRLISHSERFRDLVIRCNGLTDKVCMLASNQQPIEIQRQSIVCLSHSFLYKPIPKNSRITQLLIDAIVDTKDQELKISALWALSHCQDEYHLNLMKTSTFISHLINCFGETDKKIILSYNLQQIFIHSLKILCNISEMNQPEFLDIIINCGVINALVLLLSFSLENRFIVRQALFLISNLAAGTSQQVDSLCEVPELLKQVCQFFDTDVHFEIKKDVQIYMNQATYVLCGIIAYSSFSNCRVLIETNVFQTMLKYILVSKVKYYQLLSLSAINQLVKQAKINEQQSEQANQVSQQWTFFLENLDSEYQWVSIVVALTTSPDQDVRRLAKQICKLKNIDCGDLENDLVVAVEGEEEVEEEEEEEDSEEQDVEVEHEQIEEIGGNY